MLSNYTLWSTGIYPRNVSLPQYIKVRISHHINRIKGENHMIITINTGKAFERIQHPFPFSRGSSQPRDQTQVSCIAGQFLTSWTSRETPWRKKRLPTPVFWPGEFHGLYSPWDLKKSDTTDWLSLFISRNQFKILLFLTKWTFEDAQEPMWNLYPEKIFKMKMSPKITQP